MRHRLPTVLGVNAHLYITPPKSEAKHLYFDSMHPICSVAPYGLNLSQFPEPFSLFSPQYLLWAYNERIWWFFAASPMKLKMWSLGNIQCKFLVNSTGLSVLRLRRNKCWCSDVLCRCSFTEVFLCSPPALSRQPANSLQARSQQADSGYQGFWNAVAQSCLLTW